MTIDAEWRKKSDFIRRYWRVIGVFIFAVAVAGASAGYFEEAGGNNQQNGIHPEHRDIPPLPAVSMRAPDEIMNHDLLTDNKNYRRTEKRLTNDRIERTPCGSCVPATNNIAQPSKIAAVEPAAEISAADSQTQPETKLISVSLSVADKIHNTQIEEQSTAYDLMTQLARHGDFTFSGKDYGALGFFVEEINGKKQNPRGGEYWIYSINGEKANVGISTYVLQTNDIISWRYEKEI